MWTSVPQMPVRSTLMRTSLVPIRGIGTSSSQRPGLASFFTRASIVSMFGCPLRFSATEFTLLKANFADSRLQWAKTPARLLHDRSRIDRVLLQSTPVVLTPIPKGVKPWLSHSRCRDRVSG